MRLFLPLLVACSPGGAVLIDESDPTVTVPTDETTTDTAVGTGWTDEPLAWTDEPTEPDYAIFEDAYARIISPVSGELVPWQELQLYEVEVRTPDDRILTPSAVQWISSVDFDFYGDEATFESDALDLGRHTLTAIVDLPNGDRVAHSVTSVLVQHPSAGIYAGLFSVDGTVQNIVITCTGAALIDIGEQGVLGTGDGDCLVSLLGVDIPMTWLFEVENQGGVIGGQAGVDLLGLFTYDIPVTGGSLIDGRLQVDFDGPIPFIGELSAFLDAEQIAP